MRRTTFNLNSFLEDLTIALDDRSDLIDYEVEKYKTFLSHTKSPLTLSVMDYVNKHRLVTGNQEIKSYIDTCHKAIL
jgi:hypothetical protein